MIRIEKILLLLLCSAVLNSCAIRNSGPVGGDQDVTPPKVKRESPPNKSLNFDADKIVVSFDEYIELSNQQREITITPSLPQAPQIYLTKKNIVVNTKNSKLEPNTTYVIQFGQAIKDINEGNILSNYRYIFSTGSYIDSLYIKGKVLDIASGKSAEKVIVTLYHQDVSDSAIYKIKPLYFTNADADGSFQFDNLPKGKYKLFAITDANQNYFLDEKEGAGYNSEIVVDSSVVLNKPIALFPVSSNPFKLKSAYIGERKNAFTFTQPLDYLILNNDSVNITSGSIITNAQKDSIVLYNNALAPRFTGNNIRIRAKSGNVLLDSTYQFKVQTDSSKLTLKLLESVQSANTYQSPVVFQSNFPLKGFNQSNITLSEDGKKVTIKGLAFADSVHTIVKLLCTFDEEKQYAISVKPNAFTSIFNQQSDSFSAKIELPLRSKFGLLEAKILVPNNDTTYIVQLLNALGTIVYEKSLTYSDKINIPYLTAGAYKLRAVADINKNGRWDTGSIIEHKLPEEIIYYSEPINIKANWELMDLVFDISKAK